MKKLTGQVDLRSAISKFHLIKFSEIFTVLLQKVASDQCLHCLSFIKQVLDTNRLLEG